MNLTAPARCERASPVRLVAFYLPQLERGPEIPRLPGHRYTGVKPRAFLRDLNEVILSHALTRLGPAKRAIRQRSLPFDLLGPLARLVGRIR